MHTHKPAHACAQRHTHACMFAHTHTHTHTHTGGMGCQRLSVPIAAVCLPDGRLWRGHALPKWGSLCHHSGWQGVRVWIVPRLGRQGALDTGQWGAKEGGGGGQSVCLRECVLCVWEWESVLCVSVCVSERESVHVSLGERERACVWGRVCVYEREYVCVSDHVSVCVLVCVLVHVCTVHVRVGVNMCVYLCMSVWCK